MSKYPLTIAWRIKAHSKIIDKHLNEGEEILYAFVGQKNDRSVDIFNTYRRTYKYNILNVCSL